MTKTHEKELILIKDLLLKKIKNLVFIRHWVEYTSITNFLVILVEYDNIYLEIQITGIKKFLFFTQIFTEIRLLSEHNLLLREDSEYTHLCWNLNDIINVFNDYKLNNKFEDIKRMNKMKQDNNTIDSLDKMEFFR